MQNLEEQTQTPTSIVAPMVRATVGQLPSIPSPKTRPGAVPPLVLPPPPASPSQKSGFWSSMPGSPASRPGSFTFPGEASESPVRQNSNQNPNQSHRHSTHSKDADRMSTCSSASEQSIQSTQSNGVRAKERR